MAYQEQEGSIDLVEEGGQRSMSQGLREGNEERESHRAWEVL